MRRARPYLLLFLVLLLMGAVANFAISIWATNWMVAPQALFTQRSPASSELTWPGPTPVPWPPCTTLDESRGFAYRHLDARVVVGTQSTHSMNADEFGWPLPALAKYQYWWPWDDPQWGPSSASETGVLFLWPGVLLNPFLFAIPAWLLIAAPYLVFEALRRSRARRGLCIRCGYPLPPSGTCSECGTMVARPT